MPDTATDQHRDRAIFRCLDAAAVAAVLLAAVVAGWLMWLLARSSDALPVPVAVLGIGLALWGAGWACRAARRSRRWLARRLALAREYHGFFEAAPDAMLIADRRGAVALMNAQAEQLFGGSRREFAGAPVESLITGPRPADAPQWHACVRGREAVGRRSDGTDFPIEVSRCALPSERGSQVVWVVRDIAHRKRVERALEFLARGASTAALDDFLNQCVQILCRAFGARYAFIGLLAEHPARTVRTAAACVDGEIVGNFHYELTGTPCQNVLEQSKQMMPRGARARYPRARLLEDMDIDAYFGAPLWDGGQAPSGLVVVAHTQALALDHWAELLLDVFAARITMEFGRAATQEALQASERYNRTLFEQSATGLALARMDGELVDVNAAYACIIGRSVEETLGLTYWQITPEEYGTQEQAQLESLRVRGCYGPYEKEYIHRDGHRVPVRLSGRIIEKDNESFIWSSVEDISARKLAEQALGETEAKLQAILDHAPALISIKDLSGRVTMVNRQFEVLAGPAPEDYVGKSLFDLFPSATAEAFWQSDLQVLKNRTPLEAEEVIAHKDGALHTYLTVKFPLFHDAKHEPFGVCSISTDISERKRAEDTVRHMAYHDALTGLVNRNEFERRAQRMVESANLRGTPHALLYVDLDQFKVINDTCGHAAGDEMLKHIGRLLHEPVRERDTVARLGGDEFGLLLENCPLEQAQVIAESLISKVCQFRLPWGGRSFAVGASIGIAMLDSAAPNDVGELLRAADTACYAAKDLGRNRAQVYHANDAELARREGEMQWVSHIRAALDHGGFRLFYQPVAPLSVGEPCAVAREFLIRLAQPDGDTVPPGSFITAAERYNLMPAIDRWVISSVAAHAAQLPRPLTVDAPSLFVNLSGTSLNDPGLPAFIKAQLGAHDVDPRRLCFEVTETAAMANLQRAREFIKEIKALGCRFALDDFGSGLSSFAYLKALPVDYLKIDGGFVKNMLADPVDAAIVQVIHRIGRAAGKQIIAEFVENQATWERLRALGIDYGQGYYIGRPRALHATALEQAEDVRRVVHVH